MSANMTIIGSRWISKGKHAPVRWVQYMVTSTKGFMVPDISGTLDIEEMLDLLAERVEMDYPGQGDKAWEEGRRQLEETDFAAEWLELNRKIAAYKRWGGHPPKAVFMPDEIDPSQWNVVLPQDDGLGEIMVGKVDKKHTKDWVRPQEGENAYRDEFGWKAIPPEQTRARRRLEKKVVQQRLRDLGERTVQVHG